MKATIQIIAVLVASPVVAMAQGETNLEAPGLLQVTTMLPGQPRIFKEGTLTKNPKGEAVFAYDKDETVTLQGGDVLLELSFERMIPLYMTVRKIPGASASYQKFVGFTALSVGRWLAAMGDDYRYSGDESKVALYEHAMELREKISQNLTEPASNQDWKGLAEQYRSLRRMIGDVYMEEEEVGYRSELAALRANLMNEERLFVANKLTDKRIHAQVAEYVEELSVVEKRFYRMDDNYRPEIYPMIRSRSRASVAIVRKGKPVPLGSGALIAPNLVLTCRHNIDDNSARTYEDSDYEVWLDYEERFFARPNVHHVLRTREVYRSEKLDFVLLEIEKRACDIDAKIRPLIFKNGTVPRWTPIFIVGHPQTSRRVVHDSSWVLFPHQIRSNRERGEITAQVLQEYLGREAYPETPAAKNRAERGAEEFMKRAYGPKQDTPRAGYTMGKDGMEYIGVESDTFEGDSGAPVMTREDGRIVGILFRGVSDAGVSVVSASRLPAKRLLPGAEHHERVLPSRLIIAELDEKYENWRENGVTVEN